MALRYLFGPITAAFAEQHLSGPRRNGECLTFGGPGTDVPICADFTWGEIQRLLPENWQPDLTALVLAYTNIPDAFWHAPLPRVGLAADGNLLWDAYRHLLPRCDFILSDAVSVERFRRAGYPEAVPANLYGLANSFLNMTKPATPRDIDVLFVGNLNPAVQRERLSWLGRLARLGDRRRIAFHTGVFGADYRSLLQRARIVFNRSSRRECNMRAFEATAAGALLFQEADNREVPEYFVPGQEYVAYADDDLESLLDHYLTDEDERRSIADAGRQRAQAYGYESLWQQALDRIEPWLRQRSRIFSESSPAQPAEQEDAEARHDPDSLWRRTWGVLQSGVYEDSRLLADLEHALNREPFSAAWRNLLGVIATIARRQSGPLTPAIAHVAGRYFHRAVQDDPNDLVSALNLTEALVGMGQVPQAVSTAVRALDLLERPLSPQALSTPHFPPCFDLFRVEWERAGWDHAGDISAEASAKHTLIRWRLHALLADLTGEMAHYEEAVHARPDLPITQAALGCAWARSGRSDLASEPLQKAVAANPFDLQAARALYQVLGDLGDRAGQECLAAERRLVAQAASQTVPTENWFAESAGLLPTPAISDTRIASPAATSSSLAIVWEGDCASLHSLAEVNRQICRRLAEGGHDITVLPGPGDNVLPPLPGGGDMLQDLVHRRLFRPAEVHVRHQWPPQFQPPPNGRWVLMQPWEYGSLPQSWIEPILRQVDEVWVPSRFVRDSFVQSGIPPEMVFVIPLGADPVRFCPDAKPRQLAGRKRFKFLFVGGTIARKGFDVLLGAYRKAFRRDDDVCLVVKDMGVGTFYRGQTAEETIARFAAEPDSPEIEYIPQSLTEEEQAGLYAACDCLVHPYRGEGFGLPIIEAMAVGLPVIVTGSGAALDFCDETTAYLLPAEIRRFTEKRVGDLATVDFPWLAEPDGEALVAYMRGAVAHPAEAKAKGQAGRARVCAHWTWDQTAAAVGRRLQLLRTKPLRRGQAWIVASGISSTIPGDASFQTVAEGQEIAEVPIPHVVGRRSARVSLTMIVRDEEDNLPDCLRSIADLVDEMIVLDTGSTDRTKEIAADAGAKVFDFPWYDSFSAARNEALRHATGDWIFWLDADDRIDEDNRAKLRDVFDRLGDENAAYSMKCLCLPQGNRDDATVVDHVRLFRNHPGIRWEHRVHEQILPGVRRVGGEVRFADVVIRHTGYCDPALRLKKLERDQRLVEMELAEQPDHPFTLFNLGSILQEQGRHAEALQALRRSLDLSHPSDSIVRKLYGLIAGCHRALGQTHDALAVCREGRRHYAGDPELLFREGALRAETGDLPGAALCMERLLSVEPPPHFASVSASLRGYQGRHALADVYRRMNRHADAEQLWRQVVSDQPSFVPAWLGLAELHLSTGRWTELETVVRKLQDNPDTALEASVLQARGHMARKEFEPARHILQETLARRPRALWPRVILSHALLQEGKDHDAAEESLRDILVLDPAHAEARHNLTLLLNQQNRAGDAFLANGHTLAGLYQAACTTQSDVQAYLPRLYELAGKCRHVTLFGTRLGTVAAGLLFAQPDVLFCYDLFKYAQLDRLRALAGRTFFRFRVGDVRNAVIEPTELLVIDTRHDGRQLQAELEKHAPNARRWLALLGTARFAARGESPGDAGLDSVIEQWTTCGEFRLAEPKTDGYGLTLLRRQGAP
jgi:glycosyltransferase involved in cell wall biosynthesis/predicted Zn-dependent protease